MNRDSLMNRINKGLDEVRPYLESDGGNLSLVKVTSDFMVFIRFLAFSSGLVVWALRLPVDDLPTEAGTSLT